MSGRYFPGQAEKVQSMFPGSGPLVTIACGDLNTPDVCRNVLSSGFDGVVVGKAIMGNDKAPQFIKAVRNRRMMPAQYMSSGIDDADLDMDFSEANLDDLIRLPNEEMKEIL